MARSMSVVLPYDIMYKLPNPDEFINSYSTQSYSWYVQFDFVQTAKCITEESAPRECSEPVITD